MHRSFPSTLPARRSRSLALTALVLAAACRLPCAAAADRKPAHEMPNIVIVFTDDK